MNKKAELPFWLVSVIIILLGLIVVMIILSASGGKMHEFLDWLEGVF
jgi:hypothetical protein